MEATVAQVALLCYSESTLQPEPTMARTVTLRKMGGSVGATIPKEMAERLHLQVGDRVIVVETDDGILLTPYDPDFERAMEAYRRTASRYRNALRELAK